MGEFGFTGILAAIGMGGLVAGMMLLARRSGQMESVGTQRSKKAAKPVLRLVVKTLEPSLRGREASYFSKRRGLRECRVVDVDRSGRYRLFPDDAPTGVTVRRVPENVTLH